jgi:hypothetical protein
MAENIQNTRKKHEKNTVYAAKHLVFSIQCFIIKYRRGETGWFCASMNKKRRQTRQRPCREGEADEFQDAVLCPQARAAGAADHLDCHHGDVLRDALDSGWTVRK